MPTRVPLGAALFAVSILSQTLAADDKPQDEKLATIAKRLSSTAPLDRIKAAEEAGKLGEEALPLAEALCAGTMDRFPKAAQAMQAALEKVSPDLHKQVMVLIGTPQVSHLEAIEALLALEWKGFTKEFFPVILAQARADGSFRHLVGKTPIAIGFDHKQGDDYNTAIYALILQLDRGGLTYVGQRMEPKK